MTIHVKFFASLREQTGLSEITLDHAATADEAWKLATDNKNIPDNLLVAVNLEYTKITSAVNDGDEVAFFPPVTGG